MFAYGGIKPNILYAAGQLDDLFRKISGVKQLKQGQTFSWPQTDITKKRVPVLQLDDAGHDLLLC